jgi:aryl-alcohol dehydrogenase-like predicted oxidoreductase
LLGASKPGQLTENLEAVEAQTKLTAEVLKQIKDTVGKTELAFD